ncbi:SHOCT domain-containing protein [Geoalkalibacter halelectricus]|uniref:SHOCT domain-containing protein n=1 Tax=Geoalkalibacter halelectricus TaxID=2847045 RepID=UPI00266F2906|nr:SHOCT domain-containing protein [Geoalkalibacter halelectricus]
MPAYGWLFLLILALFLAGLLVVVFRWLIKQGAPWEKPSEKSALEILKERYARGEVSQEEFEQMKKDLE